MDTLLVSLLVIVGGGATALALSKHHNAARLLPIVIISGGCGLGLQAILPPLFSTQIWPAISFPWLYPLQLSFRLDSLGLFFLIPIFAIPPLTLLYSYHYLADHRQAWRRAVNYFFFSILVAAMALVVMAANMVTFLLAWELMSLSSFFLVLYSYDKKGNSQAGFLYIIFTQAGALAIFAAFALIFSQTGSLAFTNLVALPSNIKLATFILILVGCGSKAGMIPLHIWLPYAHPAAPSHVSALMSGVMIKVGIYGIVRFYLLLTPQSPLFGQIIIILGIISGILGVVYALGKHDLKRLLAYHSVENIGIILLGLGIGMLGLATNHPTMAAFGLAGGLLHVLNHSLFKSLLFLGAGAIINQSGTATIDQMGGLLKKMAGSGRSFLVGSIAITGLPPFNGFISECLIYYGAFHGLTLHGFSFILTALAIIALALIGGLAAACFTKVVGIALLGEPRSPAAAQASDAGATMVLAQIILAALCLLIGLWPHYFVQAAALASQSLGSRAIIGPEMLTLVSHIAQACALFIAMLLASAGARRLLGQGKEVATSPTWGCGFAQPTSRMQYTATSYADTITAFFRPFVRKHHNYGGLNGIFPAPSHYSSHVLDIFEIGLNVLLIRPLIAVLGRLRWIQHGNIHLYIGYIVVAIIILLFLI